MSSSDIFLVSGAPQPGQNVAPPAASKPHVSHFIAILPLRVSFNRVRDLVFFPDTLRCRYMQLKRFMMSVMREMYEFQMRVVRAPCGAD